MSEASSIITDALNQLVETEKFKELVARLKECKLNPFALKSDGTAEGFAGLIEANEIVNDIIHEAIVTVERAAKGFKGVLTSEEKLDAVAQFADDQVKLNILFEPFDKMIFKLLITGAVTGLNRLFGQDWLSHLPAPQQ